MASHRAAASASAMIAGMSQGQPPRSVVAIVLRVADAKVGVLTLA